MFLFMVDICSRFDSIICFGLPDQQTRMEIAAQYAKHLTKSELVQFSLATEEYVLVFTCLCYTFNIRVIPRNITCLLGWFKGSFAEFILLLKLLNNNLRQLPCLQSFICDWFWTECRMSGRDIRDVCQQAERHWASKVCKLVCRIFVFPCDAFYD